MVKTTDTIGQVISLGNKRAAHIEVNITSYTNGGESFGKNDAPIGSIERVTIVDSVTSNGFSIRFDEATGKFRAFYPTGSHSHDVLLTGGQTAADALQVSSGVIGKVAAGNVTASGGASNVQSKTATATEVAAGVDVGKFYIVVYGVG